MLANAAPLPLVARFALIADLTVAQKCRTRFALVSCSLADSRSETIFI